MPDPKPDVLALWIADEATNTDFKSVSSVINETLLIHLGGWSEEEISDLAEQEESQVIKELYNIAD